MTANEIRVPVDGGELALLDHGGDGPPVLLVHGSGHNAAAWNEVAAGLGQRHRVVAVDLRGHGQSSASSTSAQQYWRDLATVTECLGWARPLLAGHSTGGYAVTAVTAAGLVEPSAVVVIDGLVLDDRATAAHALAGFRTPEAAAELARTFGYGLRCDEEQMRRYVEERVAAAPQDRLESGATAELVRAVAERSFRRDGPEFVRRPTTAEIVATTTGAVTDDIFPSVDVYDRITAPLTVVLPDHGFYAARRAEVQRIVAARRNRRLIDLRGHHNVVMARPARVAELIEEAVRVSPRDAGRRCRSNPPAAGSADSSAE